MDRTCHWSVASQSDPAFEGERESPSCLTTAVGVQGSGHQVEAPHRRLFCREVPRSSNRPPLEGIQRFHRIRAAGEAANLDVVDHERHALA